VLTVSVYLVWSPRIRQTTVWICPLQHLEVSSHVRLWWLLHQRSATQPNTAKSYWRRPSQLHTNTTTLQLGQHHLPLCLSNYCHCRRPCSDFTDMLRRHINCHIIIIIIIVYPSGQWISTSYCYMHGEAVQPGEPVNHDPHGICCKFNHNFTSI